MRHQLFVVALTCALASPALAKWNLSGMISAGPYVSSSTDGVKGATNAITRTNDQDADRPEDGFWKHGATSNNSRIAITAETPLRDRWLNVLFKYELDIGDTGAPLTSVGSSWGGNASLMRTRDSYLGLGGLWGALKIGTNQNIYEQYLYEADPLDNATGIGGNLQIFGTPGYGVVFDRGQMWVDAQRGAQAGFYRRTDMNLWYESPDIRGFTFAAAYSLNSYQMDTEEQPFKPQVLSLGAQFKPNYLHVPFYVNIAYELHKDMFGMTRIVEKSNAGTSSKDTGLKGQVGVTISVATIGAIVEYLKYTVEKANAIREYSRLAVGLNAKVDLGFGYFGLNLGQAMNGKYKGINPATALEGQEVIPPGTAAGSGARYVGLGYFHRMGEQTQLQFMGTILQNQDSASYALPSGATCNLIAGAKHKALYTGVRYAF